MCRDITQQVTLEVVSGLCPTSTGADRKIAEHVKHLMSVQQCCLSGRQCEAWWSELELCWAHVLIPAWAVGGVFKQSVQISLLSSFTPKCWLAAGVVCVWRGLWEPLYQWSWQELMWLIHNLCDRFQIASAAAISFHDWVKVLRRPCVHSNTRSYKSVEFSLERTFWQCKLSLYQGFSLIKSQMSAFLV